MPSLNDLHHEVEICDIIDVFAHEHHSLFSTHSFLRDVLGDTLVEAYAGQDQGGQTMKASEWEPFIRTMPHSEFPSASSCLCQVSSYQVLIILRVWASGFNVVEGKFEHKTQVIV